MDPAIADPLIKQRKGCQGRLDRIRTKINQHGTNPIDADDLINHNRKITELESEFQDIQRKVFTLCTTDEETNIQIEVSEAFDDKVREVRKASLVIQRSFPVSASTVSTAHIPTQSHVKLPPIQLPTFDGDYLAWSSYQDLFLATVHNNSTLSGSQKLHYLKTTLTGEAAVLLQSIQVTDKNYQEAWQILTSRYHNEREIVYSHLKRLFSQEACGKDSASALQKLIDNTNECIRALTVLGRPINQWDDFLVYMVVEKMNPESRRQWAMTLTGTTLPTYAELSSFIEDRIRGLMAAGIGINKSQPVKSSGTVERKQTTSHHVAAKPSSSSTFWSCAFCKGDHPIFRCPTFLSASPEARLASVKKHNLCTNCLRAGHSINQCKSHHKCKQCNLNHNSLLHQEKSSSSSVTQPESTNVSTFFSTGSSSVTQVLLCTAIVNVSDIMGREQQCRVLLDSGSQASFISENCVQKLGLIRQQANVTVTGLSSSSIATVRGVVPIHISSRVHNAGLKVEVLILSKVTGIMPSFKCEPYQWAHLQGLKLADPTFCEPGHVDILLGADVYGQIMTEGRRIGPQGTPTALNTIFGYVLSGLVTSQREPTIINVHHTRCDLRDMLQRFWEVEEGPEVMRQTAEEQACEEHFQNTHTRDETGKYIVQFPLKKSLSSLGSSRDTAIKRLHQVERRLMSDPSHRAQYIEFMQEYEKLGHMELIPSEEQNQTSHYLPHHFVVKESSTTTKLRVVFDGSAKSTTGVSLNNCLMVGPKLQEDIIPLLLRFRTHIIALTADVTKMYRQFNMNPCHTNYQRIVWRESPDQPIRDYRLKTVTYGTASGPYLATKCLQQLAVDEEEDFPIAAAVVKRDFFVDDLMSGEASHESALVLLNQLMGIMARGTLNLTKWSSNDPELLNHLDPELRGMKPMAIDDTQSVKTLGVKWYPSEDYFAFSVCVQSVNHKITKRVILSEVAKLFDPVGWLAPVTIQAKSLLQELWKLTLGWDQELPYDVNQQWQTYQCELIHIEQIKIPRCITVSNYQSVQLHGFSDASEKAYAAVIYLRSVQNDGQITVKLVTAKTRVAPIKQLSIPRLELCGAVLLTKLITKVQQTINLNCDLYLWTDSTIVLRWLAAFPNRWTTFVANRVAEIQQLVPVENWHHVISEDNPADCASRGLSPAVLKDFSLWWNGPTWLCEDSFPISCHIDDTTSVIEEEKGAVRLVHQVCIEDTLLSKFSNLSKLKRVTAYCLRFINNIRVSSTVKVSGPLSSKELESALQHWIIHVQSKAFGAERNSLLKNKQVPCSSNIQSLNPYIDGSGVLRVGGRLQHANLPENIKHPILIPGDSILTNLIIESYHIQNLHAGQQLLLATIRRQFWIIKAKDRIKFIIRRCVVCRRHRAELAQQLMGSLPSSRVIPGRAFISTGVDYAGPISLKASKGKGRTTMKGYIALFICLTTKAIHLEAVSDMTTEAFLATLKRFFAIRGRAADMYSDCGKNFVGADAELKKLLRSSSHNQDINHQLSDRGVNWHFNPPGAPHQGGLWEAGVKSVKFHLRRIVGNVLLTFEEFQTVLSQISACLNSRPLCRMSEDPSDFNVLTPAHFLIGEPLTAIPEPDYTHLKINRLSKWQQLQQMYQHFWRRWSSEYLSTLQQRFKWNSKRDNLQINDIVIVKDDNLPPLKWNLGRIIQVHPGADKCVRVVTVKTANGTYKRPVVKLCPLISHAEDNVN